MNTESKVRVGFVGVGSMGQCAHLKNYVAIPSCEVVAIAEMRTELGKRVAERYGVKKVYPNHAEMLANEELDAVVASQPFNRHGKLLPDLYAAGIPVFTEKPLAGSVEVGERLVAALRSSRSWHMVGYHKRSDPASMWVKAEIDRLKETGELGSLKYVRITMPPGDWVARGFIDLITTDEPYPQVETDPPASDMDEQTFAEYTAFVNYYIHQVNLLRYFLGAPYRVTYADPSGIVLAAQSTEGVPAVIEMSPYQTTIDWQESALICFEKGWIKLDLPAPMAINRPGRVSVYRDPGGGKTPELVEPQLPWIHAMYQQAANFIAAVQGKMKPMCEAEEALEDLRVAREYIRLWKNK
ncbi:MAG: Gfo/Idh/MocA family oxidoreductase [Armatimonadota bacterium]|nr:Gfo/Idh/MocA family oxidoreductase [Armatimonadota bacterium]